MFYSGCIRCILDFGFGQRFYFHWSIRKRCVLTSPNASFSPQLFCLLFYFFHYGETESMFFYIYIHTEEKLIDHGAVFQC